MMGDRFFDAIGRQIIRASHGYPAFLLLFLLSILIFAASLMMPGFVTSSANKHNDPMMGYEILALGGLGILVGQFAWYANMVFLVAVLVAMPGRQYRLGMILSAAAFFLGLHALQFKIIPGSGPKVVITHYAIGFYLWELSFLVLFVYFLFMFMKRRT
jgi:hypothetical protein